MELKDWRRLADERNDGPEEPEIQRILGIEAGRATKRHSRRGLLAASILAAAVAGATAWQLFLVQSEVHYTTVEARRGDLRVTVTATGNLEAVNQVEVGSELSGIVATVDADFNDRVVAGQILATLDSDTLEAEVMRSRAALEAARARVLQSEATVTETRKALTRTRKLVAETWRSETDLDSAQAAYDRAVASLALSKAEVSEAEAQLQSDATSLSKAGIRAPMDGIVLERKVERGQTVAATLESPHLFTLAEDLTRMELQVDVDEADIGQVAVGQTAVFTVDAYPLRHFTATITDVRFAAQTVDAVVTYEALLAVDNADLSLRPGMTATAEITVQAVADAMLVPNAVFRFVPAASDLEEDGGSLSERLPAWGRGADDRAQALPDLPAAPDQRVLWVLRNGRPTALSVTTGPSDGVMTVVLEGGPETGAALIVAGGSSGR